MIGTIHNRINNITWLQVIRNVYYRSHCALVDFWHQNEICLPFRQDAGYIAFGSVGTMVETEMCRFPCCEIQGRWPLIQNPMIAKKDTAK